MIDQKVRSVLLPLAAGLFFTLGGPVSAQEPLHRSSFEEDQGFRLGSLDGQNGWKVESGRAEVAGGGAR